jgi:Ca-activated chloride channel family protein
MKVDTAIVGLTARTTLRQTFRNSYDSRLEATYIFPLPARAAVRQFRMVVNGRVVEGEIEERGKARAAYQKAIESGQRASIVEQERPDVFTIRVGNLAPGEVADIEFEMVGPLVFADGEATWRFPLVVAPRYVPGNPIGDDVGSGVAPDTDRVPDASRVTPPVMLPGFPNPVSLSMRVSVDGAGLPITDLRGSLPADIDEVSGRQVVTVKPGQRLDQDCIIRFRTTRSDVATALTFAPDDESDEGTYELTIMPPQPAFESRKPRDVVFVLDRSGSMGGWKMVAARRAMARMVDTLTPNDRFTVIAFDTVNEVPESHGSGLVSATDRNRWKSVEFLAGVDARGGTNLDFAIEEAIKRVGSGYQDRERQIIVVTDGQVTQEAAVLQLVQNEGKGVRFFTVGIDYAVNASLLTRMAEYGGGHCELVENDDRLDAVMDHMHTRMEAVAVEELAWSIDGLECEARRVVPARASALFAGAPLVIRGRGRRTEGDLRATITGISGGRAWKTEVAGDVRDEPSITAMWARNMLTSVEDEYDATHESSLTEHIIALSLRFKVLSRFTAFVAVDREGDTVDTSEELRQVTQLVEQPKGWAGGANVMSAPAPAGAPPAPRARTGVPQGFGGPPEGAGSGMKKRELRKLDAPLEMEEIAADAVFDDAGIDDADDYADLEMSAPVLSEMPQDISPQMGRLVADLNQPATATEFDVLVALLVYMVSGAWTLEHRGLDSDRAASVLGRNVLANLRADLQSALEALATASAMIPAGPITALAASYTLAEAASIVAKLEVLEPEAVAQADFEDLQIANRVVVVPEPGRSSEFWK